MIKDRPSHNFLRHVLKLCTIWVEGGIITSNVIEGLMNCMYIRGGGGTVSYTHLTLPTNREV